MRLAFDGRRIASWMFAVVGAVRDPVPRPVYDVGRAHILTVCTSHARSFNWAVSSQLISHLRLAEIPVDAGNLAQALAH